MVLVADIERYRFHVDWLSAKMKCEDNPIFLSEKKRVFEENPRFKDPLYLPFFFELITNPLYNIDRIAFLNLFGIKSIYPDCDLEFFEYMKWFHHVASSFLQKPVEKGNKQEWIFINELTKFVKWFNPSANYGYQIKIFSSDRWYPEPTEFDVSEIEKFKGRDQFVFLPLLITIPSIDIVKKLKGLTGYRESTFNNEKCYLGRQIIKIEDTMKYLTYEKNLFYNYREPQEDVYVINSVKFIPQKYSDILIFLTKYSTNDEMFNHDNLIHKIYTDCLNGIKKRVLLEGGDKFIATKFIEDVQGYINESYIYDCSDGDFYIGDSSLTIALTNVEKLSRSKLSQLIIELSREIHKDKLIILQSNEILEDFYPKHFFKTRIPTLEECRELLYVYFWMMLKQNNMIWIPYPEMEEDQLKDALYSCKIINPLLQNIPSLTKMQGLIQFLKPSPHINPISLNANFVFDLENYIEKNFISNPCIEISAQPILSEVEFKYDIELTHSFDITTQKDLWVIKDKINNIDCETIYFTSLPILYLAYIKKYHEVTGKNKIDTEKLYGEVKNYQKVKLKKMPSKGPKHNIDSAFYAYFHRVNYPHLYDNKPMKKQKRDLIEAKKTLSGLFKDHFEINAYDSIIKDISLFRFVINDEPLEKFIRDSQIS